jgi:hypothetical protein
MGIRRDPRQGWPDRLLMSDDYGTGKGAAPSTDKFSRIVDRMNMELKSKCLNS